MAFLAAARCAASPLLLTAAATPRVLIGAAEIGAAATPLLLTGAATTTALLLRGAATTTASTTLLLRGATTTTAATPLLLHGATTTTAASPLLLHGATTTTAASAAILGRRAVFSYAPATLHRRCFSTSLLGDRNPICAPAYLATTGSRLAMRAMCTEALTPEVQRALALMEKESAARHQGFLKELDAFELEIISTYSAAKLKSAETALTAGKVAWRVSTAVLAFGVATLVAVLQVIKDGWRAEFKEEVMRMLEELVDNLKTELLAHLRDLVRKELQVIEAKKAAKK